MPLKKLEKKKSVSPLISMVLIILFLTVAINIVVMVIKPVLDRSKDTIVITEALENLPLINSAIKLVASEGEGSKRTITLTVTDGVYRVNATNDWVYFDYDYKSDLKLAGRRGDVWIEASPVFLDYFNHYIDGGDATPGWVNLSGTWEIYGGEFSGQNGLAYQHVGTVSNFELSGKLRNMSGLAGEIAILPVPPENLVGFWTFDEGSGTTAYDWSNNTNTGNLTNMNTTGNNMNGTIPSGWNNSCKFGSCLGFDGSDDYINVSDSNSLDFADFTITLWIKHNKINSENRIMDKFGSFFLSTTTTDMQLWITNADGNGLTQSDALSWSTDTWYRLAVAYDNSSHVVNFYRDGTAAGSDTPIKYSTITTANLFIGAWSPWLTTNQFNGTIDEVRIYNRALSADEIKAEYEAGLKKLNETGSVDVALSASTDAYIVLTNPAGHTHFDDVKVKTGENKVRLVIPYSNIDLTGTARFPMGSHQLIVEHKGPNSTLNRPTMNISKG